MIYLPYLPLHDISVTLNVGSTVLRRKCLVNLYFFPIILCWNINTFFFIHAFNVSSMLFILVYNIYHFCKYACMNIRSRVISMCIESYVVILILKPVFSFLRKISRETSTASVLHGESYWYEILKLWKSKTYLMGYFSKITELVCCSAVL